MSMQSPNGRGFTLGDDNGQRVQRTMFSKLTAKRLYHIKLNIGRSFLTKGDCSFCGPGNGETVLCSSKSYTPERSAFNVNEETLRESGLHLFWIIISCKQILMIV